MQICNCVRKLSLLFKFRSKIWRITGETESISVDQFDRFFAANATEHISGRHPSFGAPLAPTRINVVDDGDVGEMYRFQPQHFASASRWSPARARSLRKNWPRSGPGPSGARSHSTALIRRGVHLASVSRTLFMKIACTRSEDDQRETYLYFGQKERPGQLLRPASSRLNWIRRNARAAGR